MPKVFRPLFSDQARGGFQGVVFNTWRGINTVKKNTSPSENSTDRRFQSVEKSHRRTERRMENICQ